MTIRRSFQRLAVASPLVLAAVCGALLTGKAAEPELPELAVVATDQGLDAPAVVSAGRYRVVVKNEGAFDHGAYLFQPPDGVTFEDLLFGEPVPGSADAAVDPIVQMFQTFRWAGGPGHAHPGGQSEAIVDLSPGIYSFMDPTLGESETGDWLSLLIVNPGEGVAEEPEANQTVVLKEMNFDGLPERIPAGEQIWKVTNDGSQPHELYVAKAPDGTTIEQLRAAVSVGPGGAPDLLDLSQVESHGAMAPLAVGVTSWAVLDLDPGTYIAFCLVPDWSGMTHGAMGMTAVFTVE